jgi:hypothetical protein
MFKKWLSKRGGSGTNSNNQDLAGLDASLQHPTTTLMTTENHDQNEIFKMAAFLAVEEGMEAASSEVITSNEKKENRISPKMSSRQIPIDEETEVNQRPKVPIVTDEEMTVK